MQDFWGRFALRLEENAKRNCRAGYVEVSLTLCFVDGRLVGWREPEPLQYEPRSKGQDIWDAKKGQFEQNGQE